MPFHSNNISSPPPTLTTRKAEGCSSASGPSKRSVLPQSGSMSTGTRTVGRSNVSELGSVASGSHHVKTPFDDNSLQYERLAMFAAQHRQEDGTPYGRLQDTMTTTTAAANRDEGARDTFYQARAAEAIRQFDDVFNSNK